MMAPEHRLRDRSILIIERDAFVARYISAVLTAAKANIVGVSWSLSGEETIVEARVARIDAAVVNYDMSDDATRVLADELARRDIPTLVIGAASPSTPHIIWGDQPGLIWPFAAHQVRDALSILLIGLMLGHRPAKREDRIGDSPCR